MLETQALPSKELYALLKELDVKFLYHANTLATSISLIKEGALLSRKFVTDNGLPQTPQDTDHKDQLHGVWDSIFLDGTDHHVIFRRRNYYGPILFKIKLEVLLSEEFETVFITRSNPSRWPPNMEDKFKYYHSIAEVGKNYTAGKKREDAQIMFTFPNAGKNMDFDKYLHSICFDDPKLKIPTSNGSEEGRDYVRRILEKVLIDYNKTHYVLEQRQHSTECKCFSYYSTLLRNDFKEFTKMFGTPKK